LHLQRERASALLRITVDPRTEKFGRRDTIRLAPGTDQGSIYDLSEDGRTLVFDATRDGQSSVWTFEQRGGSPINGRQVATSTQRMSVALARVGNVVMVSQALLAGGTPQYEWSWAPFPSGALTPFTPPDSLEIATALVDDSQLVRADPIAGQPGRARITSYQLDGKARPEITVEGNNFDLRAGPERAFLLVSSHLDSLRLVDSLGSERWHLVVPDSLGRIGSLVVSPAQDSLLIMLQPYALKVDSDGNVPVPVLLVAARTGEWRLVTRMPLIYYRALVWSSDGWIYAALATTANPTTMLYRFRSDGSQMRRIGPVPFPDDGSCDLSQDVRRWACTRTEVLSDLYLVRGFAAR
jgi:hypothetical protein